jgi:glutathione synthase/RimK-type ligase-like ATP-grasp enzyme
VETKLLVKKLSLRVPNIFSKNHSINSLRMNRSEKTDIEKRYPLGRYPVRVVLNVGSKTKTCRSKCKEIHNQGGVVINHPDYIENASNKIKCKELLVKMGLPTPNWITFENLFTITKNNKVRLCKKRMKLTYPIVAKKIKGMGGEGMVKINSEEELIQWRKNKDFSILRQYFFEEVFQPNIKFNYEYRVAVSPLLTSIKRFINKTTDPRVYSFLGEIVCLKKCMKKEAVEKNEFGRNLSLGHSFFERIPRDSRIKIYKKNKKRKKNIRFNISDAVDICRQACLACNLDFSAADMLFDSLTGNWTILELNTAPSMGNLEQHSYSLNCYKEAFKEMITQKIKLK